jgi:hypothetical protein
MRKPEERNMQFLMHSGYIWRCSKGQSNIVIFQSRQILRASIGENTQKNTLAALALKEDTIPKPDGLAMVNHSTEIERNSDNIEQCSEMIEECSHCVRGSRNLPEELPTAQSPNAATICRAHSTCPSAGIRVRILLEGASALSLGRCAEDAMRE